MTFRIRAARDSDLQHLYEMAKLTGGGFTNLPADRTALQAKPDRSITSVAREVDMLGDVVFLLVLEKPETREGAVSTLREARPRVGSVFKVELAKRCLAHALMRATTAA